LAGHDRVLSPVLGLPTDFQLEIQLGRFSVNQFYAVCNKNFKIAASFAFVRWFSTCFYRHPLYGKL